jgi:hypothetical protein
MNPARLPDLPPISQPAGFWHIVLWVAIYVVFLGGAIAYLVYKLPRHGGPDRKP